MVKFIRLFIVPVFLIVTSAYAQDLRTIGQLARDGAPGLALKLLDNVQPNANDNIEAWLFFENQRIEIMKHWKQWQKLIERLQNLPENAPADFLQWSRLEVANAFLQLHNGEKARVLLRRLIWASPSKLTATQLALYRRLIIRSYMVEDNIEDAQRAILRYQQDYGNKGQAWQLLRGRVSLRTNRPKEAVDLLIEHTKHEAVALRLLAQLRSNSRTPQSILGDVRSIIKAGKVNDADKARLWLVGAEAAEKFGSHLTQTRALEQAMQTAGSIPKDDIIFSFNGDLLWSAYENYGRAEGNQLHLLIGQDERWLESALAWHDTKPEKARAFYTVVMMHGNSKAFQAAANERFLELMLKEEGGIKLLKMLFLNSARFSDSAKIADQVRYLLVDEALKENDIESATFLMHDLERAPEESDPFEWALRRSRVLILGGRHTEGNKILQEILSTTQTTDEEQLNRLLQVIFDLQTVGKDEEAIALFSRIRKDPELKAQTHRELLFWMADSYRSLGKLAVAAAHYLQSATLIDGFGHDPWGQTSRFRAAEVLTEAGIVEDARRIYEGLMRITKAPERRAMIKYKLQELWLK